MNEKEFWTRRVKPKLHRPNSGRVAWKTPAEIRAGLPDVWFSMHYTCNHGDHGQCVRGGWLELKYNPEYPKRESTLVTLELTPEQLAHLREASHGGAYAALLAGVADDVYLIPVDRITVAPVRIPTTDLQAFRVSLDSLPETLAAGPQSR